jgi:hypothetical protein
LHTFLYHSEWLDEEKRQLAIWLKGVQALHTDKPESLYLPSPKDSRKLSLLQQLAYLPDPYQS